MMLHLCELVQIGGNSFKNSPICEVNTGLENPLCFISPSFNSS